METGEVSKKMGKTPSRGRCFILRYLLSLIFGWLFVVTLIGTISIVLDNIMNGGGSSAYYMGGSYALLLTVLVVFGVAHLAMAFSVDKKIALDEKAEKYTKVFGTIFNVGLVGIATGFVVMMLYPLFGAVTGLTDMECKEAWQMVIMGLIAIVLLADMVRYQTRALVKLPRWVYTVTMGAVTLLVIILFLIFPAGEIRGAVKDQKIINDLSLIESKIDNYVSENNRLPKGLDVLDLQDLNRNVRDYEFKAGDKSSYYYFNYTLCTDGFVTDQSGSAATPFDDDLWGVGISDIVTARDFWSHTKGYNCFDLQVYGGGYYNDYEDCDYYKDCVEVDDDYDYDMDIYL
ncbi:hypothetical protein FWF89_03220 [Candidatus Saccharibacteria bacterium]|nr:hypothetical protein [Candidatus Saccharibacteria bacterium]